MNTMRLCFRITSRIRSCSAASKLSACSSASAYCRRDSATAVFSTTLTPEIEAEDEQLHRGRERNILGSYPPVTAVFGITIADLAIRMLK